VLLLHHEALSQLALESAQLHALCSAQNHKMSCCFRLIFFTPAAWTSPPLRYLAHVTDGAQLSACMVFMRACVRSFVP
jgi:hypothetical protein